MLRTRLPTIPLSAQGFAKYLTAPGQFFLPPCEFHIASGEWMLFDVYGLEWYQGPGGLKRIEKSEDDGYKVELCAISFTRDEQGRNVLGSLILPVLQFMLHDYDGKSTGAIVFLQEEALPCVLNVLRSIAYSFPDAARGIEQACSELVQMSGLAMPRLHQGNINAVKADDPAPHMMLYDDLQRNLATGNVCAFVGAGLSVGAGLPDWYGLIAELSVRIGYKLPPREWASGDALIDAAQAYVNRQGLHSLISHLKDRLDTTGKQPSAAHHALARLPISLVFTANFDNLLERAFRDAGKRVEVIVKDSSIPFMRRGPDTVNIVKLYGDLDQPDTIVLARQQYESYFLQRPQVVKLLETELARSDTLYLGWSGADPYFKLVFGELLSRFGQMMRPGYAVMFGVTDDQRDELRRKQIRLVELPAGDRTSNLASWLKGLTLPLPSSSPSVPAGPTGGKGSSSAAGAPKPILNTGKAWAVLVGTNAYEDSYHFGPLQVCVKDVEATRAQLITGGFDPAHVRLLTDNTDEKPTRANILAALKSVADATEPDDVLLFYYSGHGDEAAGESYLVSRDGRHLVLSDTAISVTRVKQIMDAAPARGKVILLDACHSGADIGKKGPRPMTKEFIERVFDQAAGMAILASCTQGQLSYEWRAQERSVFTHYLLEALKGDADRDAKGFVTVQDASRHVTDGVKLWASQHNVSQTPTLQYTVVGDIVLAQYANRTEPPGAIASPTTSGYRQRLARWLEYWNFTADPFASWDADKEGAILPRLLMDRPYITSVLGDPARPVSSLLRGAPGAGKTAARESVWNECASGRVRAFPVRYTDFAPLLGKTENDPTRLKPHDHVQAILRVGLRTLADEIAPPFFNQLSKGDQALLQSMLKAFADPIAQAKLAQLAPAEAAQIHWEQAQPGEALQAFADLVTNLGRSGRPRYESLYVLVDRVDAPPVGVKGALPLLRSLIFEGGLLDVSRVAFKFFLPVKIGEQLLAGSTVRRGRFIDERITWNRDDLMQMIHARLEYYSDGNVQSLEQLCSAGARSIVTRLWTECNRSPRDLLRKCGRILHFHIERTDEAFLEPIDITSVLR